MEDVVEIKVQVLDAVVPEETFEEVAGWDCLSTLCEPGKHRNLI
jgi:hypothetical protein